MAMVPEPDITVEAFIPAVAVGTVEHWIANAYYPSDAAFLFALADALREEYKTIVDAGFILQLDNPNLPDGFGLYTDLAVPAYRKFQELRIAALNHSIEGLPASRVRMHVCWGAHKGPHNTDIPLQDIVDLTHKRETAHEIRCNSASHHPMPSRLGWSWVHCFFAGIMRSSCKVASVLKAYVLPLCQSRAYTPVRCVVPSYTALLECTLMPGEA